MSDEFKGRIVYSTQDGSPMRGWADNGGAGPSGYWEDNAYYTPEQWAAKQLQERYDRIEAKLDKIMNHLGIAEGDTPSTVGD